MKKLFLAFMLLFILSACTPATNVTSISDSPLPLDNPGDMTTDEVTTDNATTIEKTDSAETDTKEASTEEESLEAQISSMLQELTPLGYEAFWWYMDDASAMQANSSLDPDNPIQPAGRFTTIAALKEATEAVFSRRFCENILYPIGFNELQGDKIKFREIDGVLYVNTDSGGMGWNNSLTDKFTVKESEPDRMVLEIISTQYSFDDDQNMEVPYEFVLIKEDGQWKWDTWFEYGTPALPVIEKRPLL
jgi:uncharacterized protein YcfL